MRNIVLAILVIAFMLVVSVSIGMCMDSRLDAVRFTAWGTYLAGAGTIVLAVAAIVTGVLAIREYRSRTQAEKVKWLFELFEKFYEGDNYKAIRKRIDYDNLDDIRKAMRQESIGNPPLSDTQKVVLDEFTEYLNFFEMIAYLKQEKQLTQHDIEAMFQYYLRRLLQVDKDSRIRGYIKEQGFENLDRLLVECAKESAHG